MGFQDSEREKRARKGRGGAGVEEEEGRRAERGAVRVRSHVRDWTFTEYSVVDVVGT